MTIREAWEKLGAMFPAGGKVAFTVEGNLQRTYTGEISTAYMVAIHFLEGRTSIIACNHRTLDGAMREAMEQYEVPPPVDVADLSADFETITRL